MSKTKIKVFHVNSNDELVIYNSFIDDKRKILYPNILKALRFVQKTDQQLADSLGISKCTLYRILSDEELLTYPIMKGICAFFPEFTGNWLFEE